MAIIKHATRQTLGQLIGANNPPVSVPDDSQRQYSWTKKEVETYWNDIQKFKKGRDSGKESAAEYFIGPIVTITDEKITERSLLDGQQRLTTSTILLAALRDALWRIKSDEARAMANNLQRDYIARKAGRREPMEYFLKLSLFDSSFFRDFIQDWSDIDGRVNNTEKPRRPSHTLIKQAYSYFESVISKQLSEIPDEEGRLDWIDSLKDCLTKGLVFVEIQTPTSSDANEVFETINSRGRDLSTVDLVRNFLMEQSVDDTEKNRVNDAWRTLLDAFDKREEIERFLRHFWVSRHGDVKSHSLYATIKSVLTHDLKNPSHSYNVATFAADLENSSNRYVELVTSNTGVINVDAGLREIKTLGADAVYPLLLAISHKHEYEDLCDVLQACISYFVRWTLIGRKESTLLEENLFGLAKEVSGGLSLESVIRRIHEGMPDNGVFETDFKRASITKSSQARYILEKLERYMREKGSLDDVTPSGSQVNHVEHIYPQQPEDEWKLKDHETWVNRIGNQTLLHGRANRSASNKPLPSKIEKYKSSNLLITTDTNIASIWDYHKNFWRTEGIRDRQAELAKLALVVWPQASQ